VRRVRRVVRGWRVKMAVAVQMVEGVVLVLVLVLVLERMGMVRHQVRRRAEAEVELERLRHDEGSQNRTVTA
jgi:hypothetical protein